MFSTRQLDDFTENVLRRLPKPIRDRQQDLEKNLRAALQAGLGKLDLVTREDFDVQAAVLARTRTKLEALEQRLAALEADRPQD